MPSSAEVQAATLEKFIEGWRKWTPEGFLDSWSEDCTQQNLPFSSNVPVKTRADAEKLFPILMSLMTNFQVSGRIIVADPGITRILAHVNRQIEIHNIVRDPAQRKAVIYALTKADTPFGPYANEHSLFVWFDETGEKVQKIEEMFDAIVMQNFLPKLEKYKAEQMALAEARA